MKKRKRSLEGFMMETGTRSRKPTKDITAIAGYYKRVVKTEKVFVMSNVQSETPKINIVTKVTFLN